MRILVKKLCYLRTTQRKPQTAAIDPHDASEPDCICDRRLRLQSI